MAILLILAGFLLLYAGGEMLVRGGVGLSGILGLSPLFVGLVVISTGTSAPELLVTVRAVLNGAPDIGVGNIVGSNITNVLLILGVGALVRPMPSSPKIVFRDGGAMILACVILTAMAWGGTIGRLDGVILLAGLLSFLVLSFLQDRGRAYLLSLFQTRALNRASGHLSLGISFAFLALGAIFLYFGAGLVVDGGMALARRFGVSEAVTGLTLVALGTSLPELSATFFAALKRETDLAIGNIIGSNLFNVLGVVGTAAIIRPIAVDPMLAHEDMLLMVAAAVLLLPLLNAGWRLSRADGALLLLCYGLYIAFIAFRTGAFTLTFVGGA